MKKKILLVEDEAIIVKMYVATFDKAGFETKTTENIAQAIKLMEEWHPNIVLLDIMLAGVNGLDLLKKIQGRKDLLKIPVVVFSNYIDTATEKEALKLGAKAYIIKADYDPGEVINLIKQYIS